jgi:hypothetical protein
MKPSRILEVAAIFLFLLVTAIVSLVAITSNPAPLAVGSDPNIEAYAYSMPNQGWAPLTVYFSAFESNDMDGQPVRYEWDLNGDGYFEVDATESRGYAESRFVKPGSYTATLRVTNQAGAFATAATAVEVRHPASSRVDYWRVFDDSQVRRIDLEVSQANWDIMWANPGSKTEVEARATIFGDTIGPIGLSMKGNATLDASGDKKPWKVDINAYVDGQEYENLKMLLLHNNFGDPSMLREKMAYDMLRFSGVSAGHVSYVEVWIDIDDDDRPPTYWGVYTLVERPDRKYLASRYGPGNDGGNLYKADAWFEQGAADLAYYGEDISDYPMPRGRIAYRKMTNEEQSDYRDIINLCRVIDGVEYETSEEFAAALDEVLNVDSYLRYLAATFLHLNLDTYPYTGNNFYLYHNPASDRFEWIAWDENNSWGHFGGDVEFPLYGVEESLGPLKYAPLFIKVFQVEKYRRDYRAYMDLLIRTWFNYEQFGARAETLHDLLAPYVTQETGDKMYFGPTAAYSIEAFDDGWVQLADLTRQRSQFIQSTLNQID